MESAKPDFAYSASILRGNAPFRVIYCNLIDSKVDSSQLNLEFRRICAADLPQIKAIHEQCLPVRYATSSLNIYFNIMKIFRWLLR